MKSYSNSHLCRALLGLCALVLLAGCSTTRLSPYKYEYRYRIFMADKPMPSEMDGPLAKDVLATQFMPAEGLGRSMDMLSEEGFVLWKVEQVPASNYYTFTFRRPRQGHYRPSNAPTEFTGTYQVQAPGDSTIYYSFAPAYSGYTVVIFHGNETPQVVDAVWDGEQLGAKVGDIYHTFTLGGDGMAIVHSRENITPKGLDRRIFNARRIQTGRP